MFGGGSVGIDPDVVSNVARQIASVARDGVQVAVVIGGGNFFRGAQLQQRGLDRNRSDYMGMLGTVMNCLALQDFLEQEGIDCRVQTAINMAQVAEPYLPLRAKRHLEKGRVVIFGAGMGMACTPMIPAPIRMRNFSPTSHRGKSSNEACGWPTSRHFRCVWTITCRFSCSTFWKRAILPAPARGRRSAHWCNPSRPVGVDKLKAVANLMPWVGCDNFCLPTACC